MIKTILIGPILLLALSFSLNVDATVGNEDLNRIIRLTKNGQYQEALEQHIWFHEASKSAASMAGVRLSYAIDAWVNLAKKYPPASEALYELRNKYRDTLLSGEGGFEEFLNLSSINQYLQDQNETYNVFMFLYEHHPSQASSVYHVAEDILIEKQEFQICSEYMGDPLVKFEDIRLMREMDVNLARKNPNMDRPEFHNIMNKLYVDKSIKLIKVLIALGRIEEAKEVQKRALEYFPDDEIKNAISSKKI